MNAFQRLISGCKRFSEGKFFKRLKMEELAVNQKNLELMVNNQKQEIEEFEARNSEKEQESLELTVNNTIANNTIETQETEQEPITEFTIPEFSKELALKEKRSLNEEFSKREKELFTEQIVSSITNTKLNWKNLTKESIEEVAKQLLSEEFKNQIKKDVCNEKYKYFRYGNFIQMQKSEKTKETYTYALRILKKWSESNDLHFAALTSGECDRFTVYLIEKGYSASYINTVCNACSSFYTYLERVDPKFFRNTFKGTTAKPKIKPSKSIMIPSETEVEEMIKRFPPVEAGIIAVCAYRGLRIGAFPTLKRNNSGISRTNDGTDNRINVENKETESKTIKSKTNERMYEFQSKEKFYPKIDLGEKVIEILKKLNLNLDFPFENLNVALTKRMMNYRLKKMKEKESGKDGGIIKEIYSHHDLRHFFSINTYKLSKDIYKLSKLLGHSSVSTTEKYLKGMGEEV